MKVRVWSTRGTGAAIAEAFLKIGGISFERVEINYEDAQDSARLARLNPLAQVPTLEFEDGTILTETLAIMNWVQKVSPTSPLIPQDEFIKFQRWVTMIVTAVYPTWTYGDVPAKWVRGEGPAQALRLSTDEHRKKLWAEFEKQIKGPFFLGDTICAIDIYLAVMTNWRPGRKWFDDHAPKMAAIADRVQKRPNMIDIWNWHFKN